MNNKIYFFIHKYSFLALFYYLSLFQYLYARKDFEASILHKNVLFEKFCLLFSHDFRESLNFSFSRFFGITNNRFSKEFIR